MTRFPCALVILGLVSAGCVGKAVNQATLYQPVTGEIQMDVKLPAGESVTKVQFQVNDTVVGEDTDAGGTGTYSAKVDTTSLPPDTLAKLAAVGVHADQSIVVLKENYILVEPATASGTPTTPAVAPDAAASGTTAYRDVGATPYPKVVKSPVKASAQKGKITVIHL